MSDQQPTFTQLYSELERLEFKRVHRGRGDHDCHIYELQVDEQITLIVQLWTDGDHRASYMAGGRCDKYPSYFRSHLSLKNAVDAQLALAKYSLLQRAAAEPPITQLTWPFSKGDPKTQCWTYNGKRDLWEAAALRAFAHDLVDHIKQLQLPVREAMRQALGDGLDPMAYAKMMGARVNGLERENARLRQDVARYENGRVVLGVELKAAKEERDELRAHYQELIRRTHNDRGNVEPDGYIRYMRSAGGGPDPEEVIMYEFASRDEPHEGEGWVPLYSRPASGALNVAPIARVRVLQDTVVVTTLYAPGLPDGEHDLFPVPVDHRGEWQPSMFAEQPTGPLRLDTDSQVFFYEQDHYYLSNFSAFTLSMGGVTFPTSEHAYHFCKFPDFPAVQAAIAAAPSAHEAFKIAERERGSRREDWDDARVGIMLQILRKKARQHEYVRRKLIETGDRLLIENSWRDGFWGWGENRDGQNMLGKLWMEIRDELRGAAEPKPVAHSKSQQKRLEVMTGGPVALRQPDESLGSDFGRWRCQRGSEHAGPIAVALCGCERPGAQA